MSIAKKSITKLEFEKDLIIKDFEIKLKENDNKFQEDINLMRKKREESVAAAQKAFEEEKARLIQDND